MISVELGFTVPVTNSTIGVMANNKPIATTLGADPRAHAVTAVAISAALTMTVKNRMR